MDDGWMDETHIIDSTFSECCLYISPVCAYICHLLSGSFEVLLIHVTSGIYKLMTPSDYDIHNAQMFKTHKHTCFLPAVSARVSLYVTLIAQQGVIYML